MYTYDPKKIRPTKEDWLVVREEKRITKLESGILLTSDETGVEKVTETTGRVVSVSSGPKLEAEGIKPGDRVVYRRYLKHPNRIPTNDPEEYCFFISLDDIMLVVGNDVDIGCFSKKEKK